MKKFNIFHVPPLAFFSKELYRDVGLNWKGSGFAYLLFILGVCWIPGVIDIYQIWNYIVDHRAPKIVSQVPTITVSGGEASIEEPEPYYILDPDTRDTLYIIDTTDSITSLTGTKALGVINKKQAIFKISGSETYTYDFNQIEYDLIDQTRIKDWFDLSKRLFIPIVYPILVLGSFLVRIVQTLIFAGIGLLFVTNLKSELKYIDLLRLTTVAISPGIIVQTILIVADIPLPLAGLWYFLAAMGYLWFGIKATSPVEPSGGWEG